MKKFTFIFILMLLAGYVGAQNVLYSNNFESGVGTATIIGNGQVVSEAAPFGQVYHNAAGGQSIRANYLRLPSNVFANLQSSGSKELSIAFWVNRGTAIDYFWTPLFTAYGSGPNIENSFPMLALQSRLVGQVNNAGWTDLVNDQNVKGENIVSTMWLDDDKWHYYTAVFTETNVKIYIDGVIQNEWTLTGNEAGSSVSGLFNNGSALTYIALGGNQAWNWPDPDPAYKFDDLVIYSTALTAQQISNEMVEKFRINISENTNASSLSICAECDVIVESDALLNVDATRTYNSVTVKPGGKLSFQTGQVINADILIESDATGTASLIDSNTSPVINATIQQYVEAGRNWYISSPISNASVGVLNRGSYVAEFDETTKSWVTVNSGSLVPGKGYIQVAASNQGTTGVLSFSGTANAGNVQVSLTKTGVSQAGFNLVGNPYPSYLDWTAVVTANPNVLPTMWFRTQRTSEAGGGYVFATVNAADPENPIIVSNQANTTISKLIPPMQAYWVKLVNNPLTNNFSVSNSMRTHADNAANKFKSPANILTPFIRLSLVDGLLTDETVIYFNEYASDNFDRFDSPKMMNNATQSSIYTVVDNEKLVINGMSGLKETKTVQLGVESSLEKLLSIQVSEMRNFSFDEVTLYDNITGQKIVLSEGAIYPFEISADKTFNGRFTLNFRAPDNVTQLEKLQEKLVVYSSLPGTISIQALERCQFSIFDYTGRRITDGQIKDISNDIQILEGVSKGVYLVQLRVKDQIHLTQKVIVK